MLKFFNKEICIICGRIEPFGLDNNICNDCWDAHYAEEMERAEQEYLDWKDEQVERIATPCGCTIFNNCCTCGNCNGCAL